MPGSSERLRNGFAPIKEEFLKTSHKPSFDPTYVPQEAVNEILGVISNGPKESDISSKKKLRGKNRHRPIEKRPTSDNKLCPSVVGGRICPYNETCKFSHDVAKFVAENPEELNGTCYCYSTYGHCMYGITCLYRSQHVNIHHENLTNRKIYDSSKDTKRVLNSVSKNLRIILRKKEYSFTKLKRIFHQKQTDKEIQKSLNELIAEPHPESEGVVINEVAPNKDVDVADDVVNMEGIQTVGCFTDEHCIKLRPCEKKSIDFRGKLYLAPLTTVGNLPFRRICRGLGAEITCGEMAMSSNLLQGQASEWALLKRHESENMFGIQLCGSNPDCMSRAAEVVSREAEVDFIDINIGCPIDLVIKRGEGCALMGRVGKLESLCRGLTDNIDLPITLKMRVGLYDNKNTAHLLMPKVKDWGLSLVTVHGRSREQRYTKLADWDYIKTCADIVKPLPIFGNGDVLSHEDYYDCLNNYNVDGALIARGALIKPWIFTEIQERRTWDISASERFDIYKQFANYGLEHWGSDKQGIANTRKFLLEWLSFTHRYVPVGLLETLPQKINEKPSPYFGRNDLETLLSSPNCADWIKISEMLLGPVPSGFSFLPKHRANSFQ